VEIATLVEQHYESLYRFAFRLTGKAADAEDLTQQTYLDAQRKLDTLREPDKARAWLFMIVRNLYRRRLRDRGSHSEVTLEAIGEPVSEEVSLQPLDSVGLQSVLDTLPEEFRTVLVLFYFQELSYREISEQLDVPIGTVMSRLSRGKKHLRERMSPEDF